MSPPTHPSDDDRTVQHEGSRLRLLVNLAAGARLEQPVATKQWGKLAPMADPFGHGFCFVQFLGRGYDEICDC